MDEELKKQEAGKLKMTGAVTDQSASDPVDIQAQDLGDSDVQDPEVDASSASG